MLYICLFIEALVDHETMQKRANINASQEICNIFPNKGEGELRAV